jgi:hypothetical protein
VKKSGSRPAKRSGSHREPNCRRRLIDVQLMVGLRVETVVLLEILGSISGMIF